MALEIYEITELFLIFLDRSNLLTRFDLEAEAEIFLFSTATF